MEIYNNNNIIEFIKFIKFLRVKKSYKPSYTYKLKINKYILINYRNSLLYVNTNFYWPI